MDGFIAFNQAKKFGRKAMFGKAADRLETELPGQNAGNIPLGNTPHLFEHRAETFTGPLLSL